MKSTIQAVVNYVKSWLTLNTKQTPLATGVALGLVAGAAIGKAFSVVAAAGVAVVAWFLLKGRNK